MKKIRNSKKNFKSSVIKSSIIKYMMTFFMLIILNLSIVSAAIVQHSTAANDATKTNSKDSTINKETKNQKKFSLTKVTDKIIANKLLLKPQSSQTVEKSKTLEQITVETKDNSASLTPKRSQADQSLIGNENNNNENKKSANDKDFSSKQSVITKAYPYSKLPESFSFAEDTTSEEFNLNDYFVSGDGSSLEFDYTELEHIRITEVEEDVLEFSADENWNGQETLTIIAWNEFDSVDDTIEIIVSPVNDAPEQTEDLPDGIVFNEDEESQILDLDNYFGDIDGDELTYTISGLDNVISHLDGSIVSFSALSNWNGAETATITASDGEDTLADTVEIIVLTVNDAPVITSSLTPQTIVESEELMYTITATDIDSDNIAYSVQNPPTGLEVDSQTGIVTFTPALEHVGQMTLTLEATDSEGADSLTDTVELDLTILPALDITDITVSNSIVMPGDTVTMSFRINNRFSDDDMIIANTQLNIASGELEFGENRFIGTINAGEYVLVNYEFDVPLTATENFSLILQSTGIDFLEGIHFDLESINFELVRERRLVEFASIEFTDSPLACSRTANLDVTIANTGTFDEDVDLTVSNEIINYMEIQTVQIMPGQTRTVTFENIDVINASAQETFYINYSHFYGYYTGEVTRVLSITDCLDTTQTTFTQVEDTAMIESYDLRTMSNAADANGIIFTLVEPDTAMTNCQITQGHIFSCAAPDANKFGTETLDVIISAVDRSTFTEQLTVVVTPVNDEPVIEAVQTEYDIADSQTLTIAIHVNDADNDTITISDNQTSVQTVSEENGHATVTWTAPQNFDGEFTFSVTATDSSSASDTIEFIVHVTDENNPPVITSTFPGYDNPIIDENDEQILEVVASDPDNNELTYQWFVDGELKVDWTTYYVSLEGSVGEYNVECVVTETGTTESYSVAHSWTLTISDVPISTEFTGTMFSLTPEELTNATNVTIVSSDGKIDFGASTLNLESTVDIDRNIVISDGLVGINTANLPALNAHARITLHGVEYTAGEQVIMYSNAFNESVQNGIMCLPSRCSNIDYDNVSHELSFDVTGFSMYWIGDYDETMANHAPTITSNPVTSVYQNQTYYYNVTATDYEGDTVTFSLTTAPSGMTIVPTTGHITWNPSSTGNYNVVIVATDSNGESSTQSFTVDVMTTSKLLITDLDVKVDSKTESNVDDGDKIGKNAMPGSEVQLKFKVENTNSDRDDEITDIETTVTIQDIDDGSDIDDELEEFDLDGDKSKTLTSTFKIPERVEEGTYTVLIQVEGTDDATGNAQRIEWTLELEVEKDKHDVRITSAELGQSELECSRTTTLIVDVLNMGTELEDEAKLTITNTKLGINVVKEMELDDDPFNDDAEYTYSTTISLASNFAPGTYPIEIKTYYDRTRASDSETLNLVVGECETRQDNDILPVETGKSTVKPTDKVSEPTYKPTTTSESAATYSFTDSDEYVLILAILVIISLGLVVFGIGAMIIKVRR